jgi:hypothetical protein
MDDDVRADADIRGAVLQAFVLNDIIPPTIDAKVFGGMVTLTGTVHWQYQLDEAKHVAMSIKGVRGLYDEVAIIPPVPTAGDLKSAIAKSMERNARLRRRKRVGRELERDRHALRHGQLLGRPRRGGLGRLVLAGCHACEGPRPRPVLSRRA